MFAFDQYAFISLGANLPSRWGTPVQTLNQAVGELQMLSDTPLRVSSFWVSTPVDCPPGSSDFINAVAGVLPLPGETAPSLLEKLQAIEADFGRRRSETVNEPRVLDLDLITYRHERMKTPELELPHPRAAQRRFVLEPLAELVGTEVSLPGDSRSLGECLDLVRAQTLRRLESA